MQPDGDTPVFYVCPESVGFGKDPFACVSAPDGWTYQWCRTSLLGQRDLAPVIDRLANGWTLVPPSAHPGLSTRKFRHAVEDCAFVLLQRPTVDVAAEHAKNRAKSEDRKAALARELAALGIVVEASQPTDDTGTGNT